MKDKASSLEAAKYFTELYAAAKAKYPDMPSLELLDKEFDILEILSRERHFPRNAVMYTRWFLVNGFNSWGNYLHQFIMPNSQSAVAMEEYDYFDEEEKKGVVDLMNWIMFKTRNSHMLQLDEKDEKTAKFIADSWNEWKERKELLRTLIKKNTDIWQKKL